LNRCRVRFDVERFVSRTDGHQSPEDESRYPGRASVAGRALFRPLWTWVTTAALLIGAAALMPDGFPLARERGGGGVEPLISPEAFDRIFSVMVVLSVVVVVVGLAAGRRELGLRPDRPRWAFGLLVGVALVGLVFLLAPLVGGLWDRPTVVPSPAASPAASPPRAPGPGVSSALGTALTVALVVVLGGGVLTILWMTRSRRAEDRTEDASSREVEGPSSEAVDPSVIREPRMAVVAAYARMQRAVDSAGIERSASDTPLEVLAKVAGQRRTAWPSAGRLTGLFQRAKFSPHPVDETMRGAALSALAEVRGHLEESSPPFAPERSQGSPG
jgi:hypothetical protein